MTPDEIDRGLLVLTRAELEQAAAAARRERVRAAVDGVLRDHMVHRLVSTSLYDELYRRIAAAAIEAMEREGGER
jgi:hypothetical protein